MKMYLKKLKQFSLDLSFENLVDDIKQYNLHGFKKDLFASISVALIAIPQSIAYSLLAGLPPSAGFFSAIFGVIITALFGSSKHLVSGPSTAVAILLQSTIADTIHTFYPQLTTHQMMPTVMHILGQILFLIAVLQLIFALLNIGKLLRFVSRSVILGYFVGVIIAIIVMQMSFLLGINFDHSLSDTTFFKTLYLFSHITLINYGSVLIGIVGIVLLVLLRKGLKKWPTAFIMLVVMSFAAFFINASMQGSSWLQYKIINLGDMGFDTSMKLKFSMFVFDLNLINKIFPAALVIALLSILEVSSIAREIAVKSGQSIRANQEVFSVGLANIFLSFIYGAMPASGSLSRSMVNVLHKAKSRFSAVLSGILIALFAFYFWPYISKIPLAALAAILIVIAPSLIHTEEIKLCLKATRGDGLVFILTMLACLFFSLNIAFFIGIVISIAFYLRKAADPHLVEYAFNTSGRLIIISPKDKRKRRIRIIGVEGELFFGVVDFMQAALQKITADPYLKVIIIRFNRVRYIDATTCFALIRLHDYLMITNRHLIICGLSEEVWNTFYRTHLVEKIDHDNLFLTDETKPQLSTWRACIRADELTKED